jgi:hypothetical protein
MLNTYSLKFCNFEFKPSSYLYSWNQTLLNAIVYNWFWYILKLKKHFAVVLTISTKVRLLNLLKAPNRFKRHRHQLSLINQVVTLTLASKMHITKMQTYQIYWFYWLCLNSLNLYVGIQKLTHLVIFKPYFLIL